MNYYPHHIGDFDRATRHLTRIERSIYRDLIELYYDTEKPLTLDMQALCRKIIARSNEEVTAVEQVLNEFFIKTDSGWFQSRCDEEIQAYYDMKSTKSEAGKASARARALKKERAKNGSVASAELQNNTRSTDVQHVLNKCAAEAQQNPTNQEPVTNNHTTTPPNPLVTEGESTGRRRRRRDSQMTEVMAERFERFYKAYPRKVGRDAAEKAFVKIAPDDENLAVILDALEVAKASHEWLKSAGEFVPHPATWLNGKRWTDDVRPLVTAYTDAELSVIDAYNAAMPAEWSPAEREVFVPSRAAAIRDFVSLAPDHTDMPTRYFAHCAENLAADARYGFEWLIKRETYAKVREGAVKLKGAAQQ